MAKEFTPFKLALWLTVFISVFLVGFLWHSDNSLWWVVIPVSLFMVFIGFSSVNLHLGIYMPVKSRFSNLPNTLALTFDDGPSPEYTVEILEILKTQQAKATFFLIGEQAEKYPEIVLQIIDNGHEIANHSYSHDIMFPWFSAKKITSELEKLNHLSERISGRQMQYFRPPFGVSNPNIGKAVKQSGLRTIGWSLRSLDTVKSPDTVLKRLKNAKAGDIILLHDNRSNTPEILRRFFRSIQEKDMRFLTISQCLKQENFLSHE